MPRTPEAHADITPGVIVIALAGFLAGPLSMAYNPFFAVSVIAVGLSSLTLRSAAGLRHHVARGVLRILAVLGIVGGVGGVVALLFPTLGVAV